MSVLKTFNIALDTKQELYLAPFTLYTGDTGNRFVITLTDDGTAVDLTDCRVSVVFSGGMGTAMQDSWTGTGDVTISGTSHNVITVDVHTGAYASGLNTCQVEVYSGVDYGTLVTSAFFTFQGEKPILDDETIQAAEAYPTLVYWARKVEALTDREQSDWTQTDNTKGNYIQNKPVAGTDYQAPTQTLTAETTLADGDYFAGYKADGSVHRKWSWASIKSAIKTFLFGSVTGIAKLDGAGNVSAAAANTDFAAATHASRHAYGAADAITTDATPTESSTNPLQSGGAYTALAGKADLSDGIVSQAQARSAIIGRTSSFTLSAAESECIVVCYSSSAIVVTIPADSAYNAPIGTCFSFIRWGTGSLRS